MLKPTSEIINQKVNNKIKNKNNNINDNIIKAHKITSRNKPKIINKINSFDYNDSSLISNGKKRIHLKITKSTEKTKKRSHSIDIKNKIFS